MSDKDASLSIANIGWLIHMTKYSTDGYRILCDGNNVWIKGFCYSPVPIGGTFEWEPYGDFLTDYWQSIYHRDLPIIQSLGVNSLRLYTSKPYNKPDDPASGIVDHTDFLDTCQQHAISVWAAYPINNAAFGNAELMRITEDGTKLMCQQMADHPAVIGFIIGNELNSQANINNSDWWAWMNKLGSIAKTAAPDKLTMQCFIDDGMNTAKAAMGTIGKGAPAIDVFGINSYRGTVDTGFDSLFQSYEDVCNKPLLITEFGCPASQHVPDQPYPAGKPVEMANRASDQSKYIAAHWEDIDAHANRRSLEPGCVCAGGYIFEWCDEWWKQGQPVTVHKGTGEDPTPQFPGNWWDEEWFGVNAVTPNGRQPDQPVPDKPDTLIGRDAVQYLWKVWGEHD